MQKDAPSSPRPPAPNAAPAWPRRFLALGLAGFAGVLASRGLTNWCTGWPTAFQACLAPGLGPRSAAWSVGLSAVLAGLAAAVVSTKARRATATLEPDREALPRQLSTAILHNTREAVLITDAHANIVAVNHAFEVITGHTSGQAIGKNPRFQSSGRHDASFYRSMWDRIEREDAWQGEIWNRRRNGEVYAAWQTITAVRDDGGRITHYVSFFSDISPLKQAEEQLRHLALHDPLTRLPNRLQLSSALAQAVARSNRQNLRFALMFIDLDHFKAVNDTFGHAAGDRLLETVAQRLKGNVRAQDTVARLSGDEFTVLVEDIGSREEVAHLAGKLLGLLAEPVSVEGRVVHPSSSIGIAIFPDDAGTGAELMRAADAALYRAKKNGRHAFGFYTEELTRHSKERLALAQDLRHALNASQLRLHYQPQFSLKEGGLAGFEALLRWQHPEQGLLHPDRFLAVAEESGLIHEVNSWVLEEACRQIRKWLDQGLRPGFIAVNISGRGCLDGEFQHQVAQSMARHGLPGPRGRARLCIELSEPAVRAHPQAADVFQSLKDIGVGVAIDDFGTGCSSLSLIRLPSVTALKLDASWVRGLPGQADHLNIACAVISMGHSLGVPVVAEGVESEAELGCLRSLGCDFAQGHLMGRPVPAEEAAPWMNGRQLRLGGFA